MEELNSVSRELKELIREKYETDKNQSDLHEKVKITFHILPLPKDSRSEYP